MTRAPRALNYRCISRRRGCLNDSWLDFWATKLRVRLDSVRSKEEAEGR